MSANRPDPRPGPPLHVLFGFDAEDLLHWAHKYKLPERPPPPGWRYLTDSMGVYPWVGGPNPPVVIHGAFPTTFAVFQEWALRGYAHESISADLLKDAASLIANLIETNARDAHALHSTEVARQKQSGTVDGSELLPAFQFPERARNRIYRRMLPVLFNNAVAISWPERLRIQDEEDLIRWVNWTPGQKWPLLP